MKQLSGVAAYMLPEHLATFDEMHRLNAILWGAKGIEPASDPEARAQAMAEARALLPAYAAAEADLDRASESLEAVEGSVHQVWTWTDDGRHIITETWYPPRSAPAHGAA